MEAGLPYIDWQEVSYPTNLVFFTALFIANILAALQRDPSLRVAGAVLLVTQLVAMFTFPTFGRPVVALATDIVAWGALMYVALRYGPNWALFAAAWSFLASTSSLMSWLTDFMNLGLHHGLTSAMNMFWWFLASAAVFSGALRARLDDGRDAPPRARLDPTYAA